MKPFQAQPQLLANKNSLKQVDKVHTVTYVCMYVCDLVTEQKCLPSPRQRPADSQQNSNSMCRIDGV